MLVVELCIDLYFVFVLSFELYINSNIAITLLSKNFHTKINPNEHSLSINCTESRKILLVLATFIKFSRI